MRTITRTEAQTFPQMHSGSRYDYVEKLIEEYGGRRYVKVNGCIGGGSKVHQLFATVLEIDGEEVIYELNDSCGSGKWTINGTSQNLVVGNEHELTCTKCLKKFGGSIRKEA